MTSFVGFIRNLTFILTVPGSVIKVFKLLLEALILIIKKNIRLLISDFLKLSLVGILVNVRNCHTILYNTI